MNRRQFLKGSALAAAGIVSGASALAQGTLTFRGPAGRNPNGGNGNGGALRRFNTTTILKGVSLGMISDGKTVEEKFQIARDCGIQGIEVNCPTTDENLEEILKASEKVRMPIAGIMFGGNWKENLSEPDPQKRATYIASITKAIQQGKALGAPHVLVVPGVVNANMDYETAWKNSQEGLRQLIHVAEENRVKIGIENVWNNFLLSPVEMAYYIDQVNSPWVGCFFDIGNIVNTGWPEHWIRTLNRRLVNLHIKGFNTKLANDQGKWKGFSVQMQDEGDFDWKPVAQALVDVRYRGWLIAEVGGGNAERIKDISDRLEKMVTLVKNITEESATN